jgi:cyclin D3, plant
MHPVTPFSYLEPLLIDSTMRQGHCERVLIAVVPGGICRSGFLLFDETVLWLIHPRDKDLIFLFLLLLTKKFVLADWRWPRHRPSAWAAAALLATASSSDDDSELLVLINAPEVSTFSWCASKTVCIVAILMLNV